MNALAILFALVNAVAVYSLPRRWALLPLLIGSCYMTLSQGVAIGPFEFSVIRLLIAAGFIRIMVRGERPVGGLIGLDYLLILWAVWALISSVFHDPPVGTLVNRMGLAYNTLGIYFLVRSLCYTLDDVVDLVKMTAILLVPVALEMIFEQLTSRNLFADLFGGQLEPSLRNGRLRSQGPFSHAILAGTIGAVTVPLMIGIWRQHPRAAKVGLAASMVMIVCSASSGPIMSLMLGGFALFLWRWRHLTHLMRVSAVLVYLLLEVVMEAPPYFLIARIDLTGSSTGWHRARLIQSAFQHLKEWWFIGTDYTRHWMPTGVPWSPNHTDITNQYIKMGVLGGLPLMILFILMVWTAFRYVGKCLRAHQDAPVENQYLIWALGASLFAHAATCMSVTYYDQSFVFLYLPVAAIASLWAVSRQRLGETQAQTMNTGPDELSFGYDPFPTENQSGLGFDPVHRQ